MLCPRTKLSAGNPHGVELGSSWNLFPQNLLTDERAMLKSAYVMGNLSEPKTLGNLTINLELTEIALE